MYVGGWESDPGFPRELPIPACPALQSPTASCLQLWPLAGAFSILFWCSEPGTSEVWSCVWLFFRPSYPCVLWQAYLTRSPDLDLWSQLNPLLTPLVLAEAGARPLPHDCW